MKVFVISLKRAIDRRKFMTDQLDSKNLDYEIIDAVDFQQMTEADFNEKVNQEAVSRNRFFTKGAQACALSHAKIYDQIVRQNIPYALILEDDTILPDNINALLSDLAIHIQKNEIISLSYYHRWDSSMSLSNKGKEHVSGDNYLYYPIDLHHIASAMAYIVTRQAAQNLLKTLKPISFAADCWGLHYENNTFSSFRCLYPQQLQPALFHTTIDYPNNKFFSRIARYIRKYKMPGLYHLLLLKDKQTLAFKYNIKLTDSQPFFSEHKNQ